MSVVWKGFVPLAGYGGNLLKQSVHPISSMSALPEVNR
jgi:hypothetical protein